MRFRAALTLLACTLIIGAGPNATAPHALLWAQTTAPQFDVVSIRLHAPGDRAVEPPFWARPQGTYWHGRNYTLNDLVEIAYRLHPSQIEGGPAWANDTHFDVEARLTAPATTPEFAAMVKGVLAQRFGLHFHFENKSLPVWVLATAKSGDKLRPAGTDCAPDVGAAPSIVAASLYPCHAITGALMSHELHGRAVTMAELAEFMENFSVPVVNETGLTGQYDFDLKWDDPGLNQAVLRRTLYAQAFARQLGLDLNIDLPANQTRKVPVLVIDHAELPTPN